MEEFGIELIEKKDYQSLAEFLAKQWKSSQGDWLEKFKILWDKNPGFKDDPIRGLVIKKDNVILGFIGKFPARIMINGIDTVSSNGIGIILDPSLRGKGIGLLLKRKHSELSKNKVIFATTPNKISVKINTALGFKLIPNGIDEFNNFSMIPVSFVSSFFVATLMGLYSKRLGFLKDALLLPFSLLFFFLINQKSFNDKKTYQVLTADHLFDSLWARTKNQYLTTSIRDAKAINWYIYPTKSISKGLFAYKVDKEILGYVLFQKVTYKSFKIGLCMDLWVDKNAIIKEEIIIKSMLEYVAKESFSKDCSCLLLPHFSSELALKYSSLSLPKFKGLKRNDLIFWPESMNCSINDKNSFFSNFQGDRFIVKSPV